MDLNSIVERTLQLHEHSLRRNNIEVDFRPQPDLPSVVGDANQLIQVLLNLVTNAEQAIREVRDSGRIQVRMARFTTQVCVTFQDDGIGIRPESIPRLFDPFYTTKRPGGGTGLGLSICLSIIREHGGTIEAEALPGGGSAFTVYLPASAALEDDAAAVPASPEISGGASVRGLDTLKGRSILVLDDEEIICTLLSEGLTASQLHVDCASTLQAALAFAAKRPYDVLLCDLNLSANGDGLTGKVAAERIMAASSPHKPVLIYMSGDLLESTVVSDSIQHVWHLQKPFRISEVLALLQEIFAESADKDVEPAPPSENR